MNEPYPWGIIVVQVPGLNKTKNKNKKLTGKRKIFMQTLSRRKKKRKKSKIKKKKKRSNDKTERKEIIVLKIIVVENMKTVI